MSPIRVFLATTLTVGSILFAYPAKADCGVLNNTEVCVNDGGSGYDFLFVEGPAGPEFIRVICQNGTVGYWESNGNNPHTYAEAISKQWCGS